MRTFLTACSLVAALCVPAPASAQTPEPAARVTVTGTVTDAASGVPVAGASVSFQRSHRTVWTDDHGRFALARVEPGDERLTIEQLGYKDGQTAINVGDGMRPLALALEPNPVLLRGLAVVARRLRSRPEAMFMSVRAFDAHDLQFSNGWSVGEFLRTRGAMISVPCNYAFTTSCVWSRGQFVPSRVYLDNMQLFGGLDELVGIPVSDIYRVEVYQRGIYVQVLTKEWALRAASRAGRAGNDLPPFF